MKVGDVVGIYTLVKNQHPKWIVRCVCGKLRQISVYRLPKHTPKKCSCTRAKGSSRSPKYAAGERRTPEYAAWGAMKARCHCPSCPGYQWYGAKGVTVCTAWRQSYAAFLADMGRRPSDFHSLDRYPDTTGNYEPGNVRWATLLQQNANKRTSRLVEIGGVSKTLNQWCLHYKIGSSVVRKRIRNGWKLLEALQTPTNQTYNTRKYRLC